MMATYTNENHNNWDEYLQKFALCLRSMVNDTTGVPPALLVLGRNIPLPVDRVLKGDVLECPSEIVKKLINTIPRALLDLLEHVKDRIRRKHQLNKSYFDKNRRDVSFNVGDKVWVRNHQLSNAANQTSRKFFPPYIGPFEILKKTNDTYLLKMKKKFIPKRHVTDLKPYSDPLTDTVDQNVVNDEPTNDISQAGPSLRPRTRINYREKDLRRRN
ncbi:unnamed protein product [Orchesella dallaii]|uniref:Tf2-1-like SH3-like domain-containing protein n=1 Tax=Orchesella dallaii TaxID=48710 RepID=A0ABP1RJG9_9HEXA